MSVISKPQTPSPHKASQPSQPHVSDPRSARQAALFTIFVMFISILLLNLACYALSKINSRLSTTQTSPSSNPLKLPSDVAALLDQGALEWEMAFRAAPVITKLCWTANVFVLIASCLALVAAFPVWLAHVSHISSTVRNYALAYGLGGGIVGLAFVHVVLVPRLRGRDDGALTAVNSILVLIVAGLAFGTI